MSGFQVPDWLVRPALRESEATPAVPAEAVEAVPACLRSILLPAATPRAILKEDSVS